MRKLVAIGAVAMTMAFTGIAVVTASPANAAIRFCKFSKTVHTCTGYINGCTLQPGDGQFIFAENGDTIINGAGIRMTCQNGKWVRSSRTLGTDTVTIGETASLQLVFQGEPAPLPPPTKLTQDYLCGRNAYFCAPIILE